jgi:hypothetical protein
MHNVNGEPTLNQTVKAHQLVLQISTAQTDKPSEQLIEAT